MDGPNMRQSEWELTEPIVDAFVTAIPYLQSLLLPENSVERAYILKEHRSFIEAVFAFKRYLENEDREEARKRFHSDLSHILPISKDRILDFIAIRKEFVGLGHLLERQDADFFIKLGRRLDSQSPACDWPGMDAVGIAIAQNWQASKRLPFPLSRWKRTAAHVAIKWLCDVAHSLSYKAFCARLEPMKLHTQTPAEVTRAKVADGALILFGPSFPARRGSRLEKF